MTALLLDIEGTTTPIDFVTQVLFPFARKHVKEYVDRHPEAAELLRADLAAEVGAPTTSIEAAVNWLMDRDRKSTGLKALLGRIWEEGYHSGALRSVVFDDVPPALERWSGSGRRCAIYSSGSVLAQKLLFAHTQAGDLTPRLSAYFDTTVGGKREGESYRRIATSLEGPVLFVSDVRAELDAARETGMQTRLCVRPGNAPAEVGPHVVIRSLDELP
jgi:enolase-phosphatase E1